MDMMYGLVFRDESDNDSLNIAVFNTDKDGFFDVWDIDEDFNDQYKDLGFSSVGFVEFEMNSPTVAGFKLLVKFELEDQTSRDLIVDCYKDENPTLVNDIFTTCNEEKRVLDS